MPVTSPSTPSTPAITALDIINSALWEINVLAAGETATAEDGEFARTRLNDLLDEWAARKIYAYNITFNQYTITPNHSPHLIGPGLVSPDFAATQRPVKVEGATLIFNTSPTNVELPLNIRDDDWWNNQRVKSLTSSVPTDLYYSPDWPNGSIYLWPVPTTAYGLRLEAWGILSQIAKVSDAFSLPPGYRKAITLTLAESLAGPFKAQLMASTVQQAQRARTAVQGNNSASPRISTVDSGMPSKSKSGFNWMTGQ